MLYANIGSDAGHVGWSSGSNELNANSVICINGYKKIFVVLWCNVSYKLHKSMYRSCFTSLVLSSVLVVSLVWSVSMLRIVSTVQIVSTVWLISIVWLVSIVSIIWFVSIVLVAVSCVDMSRLVSRVVAIVSRILVVSCMLVVSTCILVVSIASLRSVVGNPCLREYLAHARDNIQLIRRSFITDKG